MADVIKAGKCPGTVQRFTAHFADQVCISIICSYLISQDETHCTYLLVVSLCESALQPSMSSSSETQVNAFVVDSWLLGKVTQACSD